MPSTRIRTSVSSLRQYLPERASLLRAAKSIAPFAAAAAGGAALYNVSPEFRSAVDQGRQILNQHPRFTEMTSSGIFLGLIPDYMAQKYEGIKLDLRRWGSMTLLGAVNGGIVLRAFYNAVNNAFPEQTLFNIAERTLIDQFIFSPFALLGYYVCANYIEGKSTQDLSSTVRNQYPKTMAACWVYWGLFGCPLVNSMPPDLRVVTANALSIIWMVFMSNLMHKPQTLDPRPFSR